MSKKNIDSTFLYSFAINFLQRKASDGTTREICGLLITKGNVTTTDINPATIKGRQDVNILPQIEGKIMSVAVKEGQQVKCGQTLLVIGQVRYRATLQTTHANLNAARANVSTVQLTYEDKKEL
ncbi:MAG: biotin/lipoyl-binding protein [Prevotella sp.]|jgi:membrane fusion protein (multidrug efflux system)|nr:biotin/lipoyl-binding protein [Prevotella sp.]